MSDTCVSTVRQISIHSSKVQSVAVSDSGRGDFGVLRLCEWVAIPTFRSVCVWFVVVAVVVVVVGGGGGGEGNWVF